MSPRAVFFVASAAGVALVAGSYTVWAGALWFSPLFATVIALGLYDIAQTKHAIRRNFPVAGRLRYLFESIRPEIHQYFVESNDSGRPFTREQRSLVYQRAKNVTDTLPFGVEQLTWAFLDMTTDGGRMAISWAKTIASIPFKAQMP